MKLLDIITEMPVRSWQKIGDFDQPRSMTRAADLALVKHPKYQDKVRKIFAKSSMPIDMIFLNSDDPRVGANQSKVPADLYRELTGQSHPAPDAITMLYGSSQEAVGGFPNTGWILAHKIGECTTTTVLWEFANGPWREFMTNTRNLLRPHYGQSPTGKNPGTYISTQRFFELVFTMKSARDGRLFNITEALAECVAQYLVTGTVTFRSTGVPEFDEAAEQLRGEMIAAIKTGLDEMRGNAFMN